MSIVYQIYLIYINIQKVIIVNSLYCYYINTSLNKEKIIYFI